MNHDEYAAEHARIAALRKEERAAKKAAKREQIARITSYVKYLQEARDRTSEARKFRPLIMVQPLVEKKQAPPAPAPKPNDPWARIRERTYGRPAFIEPPGDFRQLTPEEKMTGRVRRQA